MSQPNGRHPLPRMVKSTVNIPGNISTRAKVLAAQQGISLQALLVYGLGLALKSPPTKRT